MARFYPCFIWHLSLFRHECAYERTFKKPNLLFPPMWQQFRMCFTARFIFTFSSSLNQQQLCGQSLQRLLEKVSQQSHFQVVDRVSSFRRSRWQIILLLQNLLHAVFIFIKTIVRSCADCFAHWQGVIRSSVYFEHIVHFTKHPVRSKM